MRGRGLGTKESDSGCPSSEVWVGGCAFLWARGQELLEPLQRALGGGTSVSVTKHSARCDMALSPREGGPGAAALRPAPP